MEIALLHYAAPPIVGGVEHVIGEQAKILTEAGHRVRIIAGRGASMGDGIAFDLLPLADSRNDEILAAKMVLDTGKVPADFGGLVNRIAGSLTELLAPADVMIAHNVCSLNKNLPLTAAVRRIAESRRHPRLILWHHDLAWTTPRYGSELHEGYPWDLLRTAWPEVTQVCVSEWRREQLAELLRIERSQIRVIPNGVDPARILRLEWEAVEIVGRLQLMQAEPLILVPVRITPRKNLEMAVRIAAGLRRERPKLKMVITGPLGAHNPANLGYLGSLLELRRALDLEAEVQFLAEGKAEPVSDRCILDLYAVADLVLVTSTEEGFGLPILEGGLGGKLIFCTDIGPLRELGGSGVTYVQPGASPDEVAAQIGATLASSLPYLLKKRVLAHYTWERIYFEHLAPLLELV